LFSIICSIRNIKIRYKQTAIGVLWMVLQPLLTMGVFTILWNRTSPIASEARFNEEATVVRARSFTARVAFSSR
jgi:ABC-type polysaccharide/polyol phosphate export permease